MSTNQKTSKITKRINRKISTGNFESVDIMLEITEDVEWTTIEERMKKTDAVSKVLCMDFLKTLDLLSNELQFDKKVANISKK